MDKASLDDHVKVVERIVVDYVDQNKAGIPDMPLCDMTLFIGMKYLYIAMKHNMTTKDELSLEKKKLVVAYQYAAHDKELYLESAKRRNAIASRLVELERCGCQHCIELIRLFDGRALINEN